MLTGTTPCSLLSPGGSAATWAVCAVVVAAGCFARVKSTGGLPWDFPTQCVARPRTRAEGAQATRCTPRGVNEGQGARGIKAGS